MQSHFAQFAKILNASSHGNVLNRTDWVIQNRCMLLVWWFLRFLAQVL